MSRDQDEGELETLAASGLKRWLGKARDAVMAPWRRYKMAPDPTGVFQVAPDWKAEVDTILTKIGQISMGAWSEATDVPPVSRHAFVVSTLAQTENLLTNIPDEVYNLVFAELTDGVNAGESLPKLAERVEAVLSWSGSPNWPGRARLIAVTECLPPEALVGSANITAAYRRWYEGDFITVITEHGYEFSGTPNHPVLTQRGWQGLGSLSKDDRLVCYQGSVQVSAVPRDPDVETGPLEIAKLFDSLYAVGIQGRIAGRKPDFHGDGLDGNIDISITDGTLRFNAFESLSKNDLKVAFKGTDPSQALLACESASFVGNRITDGCGPLGVSSLDASYAKDPSNRIASTLEFVSYLLATRTLQIEPRDFPGIESIASRSRFSVPIGDRCRTCGAPVPDRYLRSAENAIDSIKPDSSNAGDRVSASSGKIFLDYVRDITHRYRATHVYNLSTAEGYFLSGGIYTGNTTRAYGAATLAAGMEQSRVTGRLLRKRWSDERDPHVRATHRAANGQVRQLWEPFAVGETQLMFPGDPLGPPDEVCNCRCDLIIMNEEGR